ncbi:MAG TPA: rRNA maturation RNase YbeY [Bacteroidales bacterium]|nr:rRNA maturation RNase YbeY [Bacteroidales bacterium]HPT01259.1 rRNA maturation RNase YbeY [Bacteroidales bacterium]
MINFNFQNTALKLQQRQLLRSWIKEVISWEGLKTGEVNYIFCDDENLYELNINYLKHNTLTDIITFDYTERNKISGDIYISVERVSENAKKFDKKFYDELYRVMIHGILHLAGYKDKDETSKIAMRRKEDECLNLLNRKFETNISDTK